jgi:hypothetical protein
MSSVQRLRTHAEAKHKFNPTGAMMETYFESAMRLNSTGWRISTLGRLRELLGSYGRNDGVVTAVVAVLYEFNYRIQAEDGSLMQPSSSAGEQHHDSAAGVARAPMDCDDDNKAGVVLQVAAKGCPIDGPLRPGTGRDCLSGRGSRHCANQAIFHSGLVARFSEGILSLLANDYFAEAKRLSGRKSAGCLRTAQVLHRYLEFQRKVRGPDVPRDLATDWRLAVSVAHVEDFVLALQSCLRPHTVRNQAQEILRFLKDAGAYGNLLKTLPRGLRSARLTAIDRWTVVFSRLQKQGQKFTRARVLRGELEPLSFLLLRKYLTDPRIVASLKDSFEKLELRMNSSYNKENFGYGTVPFLEFVPSLSNDWLFVVRFLVCSVLMQAQRLCVHLNMTLAEFEAARKCGPLTVIRVEDHKTSSIYGAAAIVLDCRTLDSWNRYHSLRVRFGNPSYPFLLNACGSKLSSNCLEHLNYYMVNNASKAVTHNHVRRHVETASTLYAHGNPSAPGAKASEAFLHSIRTFLCHSGAVVRSHYLFRTDEIIIGQYRTLMYVIDQSVALELSVRCSDRVLPQNPLGRDFPTPAQLVALLNAVDPSLVQLNEIHDYVYKEVKRKWLEASYDRLLRILLQEMKEKIPDGLPSSSSNLRAFLVAQAAESAVEGCGSVWDCLKSDIKMELAKMYRDSEVRTRIR